MSGYEFFDAPLQKIHAWNVFEPGIKPGMPSQEAFIIEVPAELDVSAERDLYELNGGQIMVQEHGRTNRNVISFRKWLENKGGAVTYDSSNDFSEPVKYRVLRTERYESDLDPVSGVLSRVIEAGVA